MPTDYQPPSPKTGCHLPWQRRVAQEEHLTPQSPLPRPTRVGGEHKVGPLAGALGPGRAPQRQRARPLVLPLLPGGTQEGCWARFGVVMRACG